jgi:hypothetical protein
MIFGKAKEKSFWQSQGEELFYVFFKSTNKSMLKS